MNYGYVKVAVAVPRVKVADCKFNASEIEKEIIIADGKGVQIIAFPELCITGYTCGDLFAQQLLLEEAEMGLIQILNNTRQMDMKGVQIIAFPELCITGYTCGDLFAQQLLLEEAEMGLIQILNNTRQMDIISILGMPVALNGVLLNAFDIGHARCTERCVAECGGCHSEGESAGRCPEDLSSQL